MPPPQCSSEACTSKAVVKRALDEAPLCAKCFIKGFEEHVHETIISADLFRRGERVAIGASGGKDSTVLAYVMKTLNERYDYGLDLILISIDEGIKGYRDDSLKAVERNRVEYCLPLTVLSYKDLYGWTMDDIVAKIGKKNNCTFCGVFRRQALDRGAYKVGATKLVTGHNADDMAETVLMNVLRGDIARLQRCTNIITGEEGDLPRVKPLKTTHLMGGAYVELLPSGAFFGIHHLQRDLGDSLVHYPQFGWTYCFEKDIVMYARLNKLDYFYTECIYAPDSYRAYSRSFVKDLERMRPECILGLIKSGELMVVKEEVSMPTLTNCTRCGYISSQKVCKACLLLEGLNTGRTDLGVKRKPKKVTVAAEPSNEQSCGTCSCEKNATTDF